MPTLPSHILDFVLSWEGHDEITNDKDDSGGLTRWGISQRNHPDVDVRNLTLLEASEIYLNDYWMPANCDNLKPWMQLVVFNCAVNCGVSTAVKCLQKTVGTTPDGKYGIKTHGAMNHYFGPRKFTAWYLTHQALYYFNIVERRKSQHKWLKGWIRRTLDAAWQTAVNTAGSEK